MLRQFTSRRHLRADLDASHADLALLACCYVTGLLDCSTFNNWSVFVGMQTGNTVLIALSTAQLAPGSPYAYAALLTSLCSFLVGAYLSQLLGRTAGLHCRLTQVTIYLAQTLLLLLASILVTTNVIPRNDAGDSAVLERLSPHFIGVVAPLGLQSGMTIGGSRVLGFSELPVNVLTSTYADLVGDPNLWARRNTKRDRRLGAIVLVFLGAFCSTWIMKKGPGILLVLWLATGIKGLVTLAMLALIPDKKVVKSEKEEKGGASGSDGDVEKPVLKS